MERFLEHHWVATAVPHRSATNPMPAFAHEYVSCGQRILAEFVFCEEHLLVRRTASGSYWVASLPADASGLPKSPGEQRPKERSQHRRGFPEQPGCLEQRRQGSASQPTRLQEPKEAGSKLPGCLDQPARRQPEQPSCLREPKKGGPS
jgi:hypothetical protein